MNERRQSLKINAPFQVRFLLEILLLTFIFINILMALLLYLSDTAGIGLLLVLALGIGEFAALGAFYVYLLRTSHRIAGPVYALHTRLQELKQGDLTAALRFRKKDYFQGTSESFNECVAELRNRVIGMSHLVEDLQHQTTEGTRASELADKLALELRHFKIE